MKNNLSNDPSPYLQQHKNNPVNWQLWNKSTLKDAKTFKKPILLSIGYASCHWCHVIAHESFEDLETAKLMNQYFINIKVDREERPDIDFVFQNCYQLFNRSGGGWPLTIFLDENAVPFMSGTYFPKIEKNGLPSFKDVLKKVGGIYETQRTEIIKNSPIISKALEIKKNPVINQDLTSILDLTINNLDEINGGYKGSPKFPVYYFYETLLYFYNKEKDEKFLKPISLILLKLCSQGIYDHVEGGISRYTVDDKWLIPHFEKMLYDNVQFVSILSKYLKINSDKYFIHKIEQTINFLKGNFTNREGNGLLGSAYDADSEGEEGKYYVFSFDELKKIENIEKYFEISPTGNWEGKIILKEKEAAIIPQKIINSLKELRQNKTKPFFDNKSQLDLNCMWVSALISAHKILPQAKYLLEAERFFKKIEQKFSILNLFHSNSKEIVFLEDHAYMIKTLIDLYEETLNTRYKLCAQELTQKTIEKFYHKEKNLFQKNPILSNDIFSEPLDVSDHTIPNGNAIMLMNFARLGMLKEGKIFCDSLNGYLNIYKSSMSSTIKSIDFFNEVLLGKNCNTDGCKI